LQRNPETEEGGKEKTIKKESPGNAFVFFLQPRNLRTTKRKRGKEAHVREKEEERKRNDDFRLIRLLHSPVFPNHHGRNL